jgi:hypothetical protein
MLCAQNSTALQRKLGMDQLNNLTLRTCVYLIANELQIPALNCSRYAIGNVPPQKLRDMTCHLVSPKSRIEAGIAVGQ